MAWEHTNHKQGWTHAGICSWTSVFFFFTPFCIFKLFLKCHSWMCRFSVVSCYLLLYFLPSLLSVFLRFSFSLIGSLLLLFMLTSSVCTQFDGWARWAIYRMVKKAKSHVIADQLTATEWLMLTSSYFHTPPLHLRHPIMHLFTFLICCLTVNSLPLPDLIKFSFI